MNSYFPASQPQQVQINLTSNPLIQSARTIKPASVVISGKSTAPSKVPIKAEYLQISASSIQRAGIFQTGDPNLPSMPENVAQRNEGHVMQFSPGINESNKLIASSRMTNSASLAQELSAQSVEYFVGGKSKQSATAKQPVRKQTNSSKMTGAHHPN